MMGIYIKGMEMPKGIEMIVVFSDGTVHKCLPGMRNYVEKGIAIPVPPHGRLGDLNALAQQIEHERFHHTHTDSLTARHHVAEYGHFLKAIFDAPTIIPASEEGEV